MTKIVLLDRDGVINHDSYDYIKSVDELILIPESIAAIARLTACGYTIGIATNQSGVSRGLYTEDTLIAINQKISQVIEDAGGAIHAIQYCMHLPSELCSCRKPQPGMLLALARQFNSSLTQVPFVGDRVSDIQAALAAGAEPIMILSPMTDTVGLRDYPEVPVYHSLAEYVQQLLANI